jgi:hypothetical protein
MSSLTGNTPPPFNRADHVVAAALSDSVTKASHYDPHWAPLIDSARDNHTIRVDNIWETKFKSTAASRFMAWLVYNFQHGEKHREIVDRHGKKTLWYVIPFNFICAKIGCSELSVRRAIRTLSESGFIVAARKRTENYLIYWHVRPNWYKVLETYHLAERSRPSARFDDTPLTGSVYRWFEKVMPPAMFAHTLWTAESLYKKDTDPHKTAFTHFLKAAEPPWEIQNMDKTAWDFSNLPHTQDYFERHIEAVKLKKNAGKVLSLMRNKFGRFRPVVRGKGDKLSISFTKTPERQTQFDAEFDIEPEDLEIRESDIRTDSLEIADLLKSDVLVRTDFEGGKEEVKITSRAKRNLSLLEQGRIRFRDDAAREIAVGDPCWAINERKTLAEVIVVSDASGGDRRLVFTQSGACGRHDANYENRYRPVLPKTDTQKDVAEALVELFKETGKPYSSAPGYEVSLDKLQPLISDTKLVGGKRHYLTRDPEIPTSDFPVSSRFEWVDTGVLDRNDQPLLRLVRDSYTEPDTINLLWPLLVTAFRQNRKKGYTDVRADQLVNVPMFVIRKIQRTL